LTDKGTKDFSGSSVELEADNDNGQFYFDPSCARTKGTVTVTIKNVGDTEHNFSISSMSIDKDIEKGQTATVTVTLPSSGVVQFFCKYHKSSGMQGAFIVS
jgi:plastocyanin